MTEQQNNQNNVSSNFRYLLLSTAIITFLLIVIGIVLRVTGTGSACPDWPTCYGDWKIPANTNTLIPSIHRAVAMLSGILVCSPAFTNCSFPYSSAIHDRPGDCKDGQLSINHGNPPWVIPAR